MRNTCIITYTSFISLCNVESFIGIVRIRNAQLLIQVFDLSSIVIQQILKTFFLELDFSFWYNKFVAYID